MLAHLFPFRITSQGYLIAFNQQKNSYVLHIFSIVLQITNFLSIQSCPSFPATIDITTGKISSLETSISNKTLSVFSKFTSIKVCSVTYLDPYAFPLQLQAFFTKDVAQVKPAQAVHHFTSSTPRLSNRKPSHHFRQLTSLIDLPK